MIFRSSTYQVYIMVIMSFRFVEWQSTATRVGVSNNVDLEAEQCESS